MKQRHGWCALAGLLLAGAVACGSSNPSGDGDHSGGKTSTSSGGGGAGGTSAGGTSAGGTSAEPGGTSGSPSGGTFHGGSGSSGAGMDGVSGADDGGSGGMDSVGAGGSSMLVPGFSEGEVLAPGVHISGEPKLAVNRAGDAIVAWPGRAGTRIGIWTIRYDPTSETWGEPFALNVDETYDAKLHDLALDATGNAYVAWSQGFIFVTRYDAATASWADAVQIEQHDDGGIGDPRVAAGPNGTAAVVWPESDGSRTSLRCRRYDPENDEWSYWEAIDDRDYRHSGIGALAIDASGHALAAWQQSGDSGVDGGPLLVNRFDADAGAWGTPEVLDPETGATSPFGMVVAADPDGNFLLVWIKASTELAGDGQLWARRYLASGGWQDPVKLEGQTTLTMTEPHVALDDNGNAMTVWTADDHMWGTRYDAEADTWSEPTKIDDTAGWVAKWASVAMDPDGNALAVSSQWPAPNISLDIDAVANRYDAATATWGPGRLLEHHDHGAQAPSVGMDGRGRGIVVWYRETSAELWVSEFRPD